MANKGDIINSRWELIEKLGGESGQGHAYKVKDLNNVNNKFKNVIKLLKNLNEKTLNRFQKEIEASISLNHPNIIKVVDYKYKDTNEPYLVTELCSGGELKKDKIEKLSLSEKLKIFESICEAVSFAHKNKVIHRDIKPSNIFFEHQKDNNPIIGDFGLCFFETDETDERLTETLEQVGAKNFRPPEAEYGIIDEMQPSFDVYSLGKLLYWFLSNGKIPIRENVTDSRYDLRKEDSEPAIHIVYEIFDKSIREEPTERYKDATEMFEDIRKLIEFVENDARYLDCSVPQKCIFCRTGVYKFFISPDISKGRFNYNKSRLYGLNILYDGGDGLHNNQTNVGGYPAFLIGRCNRCGNVQQFRLEYSNYDGTFMHDTNWKSLPKSE